MLNAWASETNTGTVVKTKSNKTAPDSITSPPPTKIIIKMNKWDEM